MKPPRFDHVAPATLAEAIALLEQHGEEAKIIAGGQSLMPLLNMRLARPGILIDLNRIPGLDYIREADGALMIGGLAREQAIGRSPLVESRLPLLRAATQLIGHPQIRNRGTIGGSLAHADPAAEYPATALALDAELRATGPGGERRIAACDFFLGLLTTALEPTEILTEVRFPLPTPRTGWSVLEMARRRGDFALAGVALTWTLGANGACSAARIALFGVAGMPVRARGAEAMLVGQKPDQGLIEQVGRKVEEEVAEPMSDIHATAEYRRHLAGVLTRRGLAEAISRAQGA